MYSSYISQAQIYMTEKVCKCQVKFLIIIDQQQVLNLKAISENYIFLIVTNGT